MATRPRSRAATRAADRPISEDAAVAFLADLGEARYRSAAGLVAEPSNAELYERHARLFRREAVDALRSRVESNGSQPADRVLLGLVSDGFVASRSAELTDAIEVAERRATIGWRDEQLAYRAVPGRIATIGDRGARNGLFDIWLRAVEAVNPLRAERLATQDAAVRELGYPDLVALVRATRGWNPDQVAAQVRGALNDSETGYYAAMRRAMARIGIEQGDGTLADAWYVLRGTGWDAWFEERRLVPTLEATAAAFGMTLRGASGITVDLAVRTTGLPRAACIAVHTGDVRLVLRPHGGWDDFGTALQATGQLATVAGSADDHPTLSQPDAAVAEGYGDLLQGLLGEPEWLEERLGMGVTDQIAFLDFHALTALARLRRLGGQLIYELGLHRGGEDAVHRAMYAGTMGLLAGVTWPEGLYLSSVEDGLAVGTHLRGMMVAGALDEAFTRAHPAGWWRMPASSAELRDGISRLAGNTPEQAVASLGYDALDWRPVLRKIRTQLIGEMSGYGGPNITTRAGTRKI